MTIGQIYKQSFKIVWKNKVLWAFGLAALAVSGAGFGSGFSGFNNASRSFRGFDNSKLSSASASLNSQSDRLSSVFSSLSAFFLTIPLTIWLILGLGILVAIVTGILISLLLRGWAVGSLIGGTFDALDDRNAISFATVAMRGRRSFKSLAKLYFFPGLFAALLTVPFILIGAYFFISNSTILGIIFVVLTVLVLLLTNLTIVAAGLWAERLVAIANMPWRRAFWQGLRMFRDNFVRTLQLGVVNCLTGCVVGCLSLAIIGPLVAALVVFGLIPIIGWALLPVIILLIIAILVLGGLMTALVLTFKYTTWSILYRELTIAGKENNG